MKRIVERVSRSSRVDCVAIATTMNKSDDPVASMCAEIGMPCIRGSENDVLNRMLQAAEELDADILVRLTGDNPMVDGALVDFVLDGFFANQPPPDYVANFGQTVEETGFPYGLYVEVVTVDALERTVARASEADREHVTWFIRTHPDEFRIVKLSATVSYPYASLTVDTMAEYEYVRQIFETQYSINPEFDFTSLSIPISLSELEKKSMSEATNKSLS